MRKNLLFMFAALLLVSVSCNNSNKTQTTEPATVIEDKPTVVTGEHNARNSLDYIGTYEGELPAADASAMKVVLQLVDANNFVKTTIFIDRKNDPIKIEKGTFSWNEAGNTIILDGIKNAPNKYFVAENKLIQLDIDGNRITGNLADRYVLNKRKHSYIRK